MAQETVELKGKVISAEDGSMIDFTDIYLNGTGCWCITDTHGLFSLNAPAGTYTLMVPIGFETDTLGGVINIVTRKQSRGWYVDASYLTKSL